MFPYQQMAVGLMPQGSALIFTPGCRICTATCYDTGCWAWPSYVPPGGGCDLNASRPITVVQVAQVQPGDPIEELQALRKRLEVALAGAEAQEHALRKQREGATDQKK